MFCNCSKPPHEVTGTCRFDWINGGHRPSSLDRCFLFKVVSLLTRSHHMLHIHVFTFCGAAVTQRTRNASSQLDFWYDVIIDGKATWGDYLVFILLALEEVCDFFFFFYCEIIQSLSKNLPSNWFKYHCDQVLENSLARLLITQTHEHMYNNIQVPLPTTKGALRITTFFLSVLFGIPTWMNVWLCYFSRSGRLAHVVDSLINASLGIKNTFSDSFFHFDNFLLLLQWAQTHVVFSVTWKSE